LSWLSWWQIESSVEVEAAKVGPYCRPLLRAVQLSSEVYSAVEKDYDVMYSIDCVHLTFKRQTAPIL
jgi:hypothetical protein